MMKLLVLLGCITLCFAEVPRVNVTTPLGVIEGLAGDEGMRKCHSFRGIPYAEPSSYTGAGRWESAKMKAKWNGVLEALAYGPACPQECQTEPKTCPTKFSEECLLMNIWTPAWATKSSYLPVQIFIHGGNFRQDSSDSYLYWGGEMCNYTSSVVVTFDYRLGALGFLQHPKFYTPANLGIQDQRLLFKWVQENIVHFGGNPRQVTVFGQSAGAGSVLIHMVQPELTRGLFSALVSQSNPAGIEYKTQSEAQSFGKKLAQELNCEGVFRSGKKILECMKSKDYVEIVAAQQATQKAKNTVPYPHTFRHAYPWSPTVGVGDLPLQPLTLAARGTINPNVPFMAGFDQNDALQFVYGIFPKHVSPTEYKVAINAIFGLGNAKKILKQYPLPAGTKDARHVMSKLTTDFAFACANRYINQKIAEKSNVGVYMYNYTHALSFNGWGKKYAECEGFVCHASELPIEFDSSQFGGFKETKNEHWLGKFLDALWADLYPTGIANKPLFGNHTELDHVDRWDPLPKNWTSSTRTPVYILGVPQYRVQIDDITVSERCKLWDEIGYLKF